MKNKCLICFLFFLIILTNFQFIQSLKEKSMFKLNKEIDDLIEFLASENTEKKNLVNNRKINENDLFNLIFLI